MKFVLFKGRHSHPEIDGLPAIFPDGVDVMDFARLFEIATAAVSKVAKVHGERLDLYCTGLTPAVCAVVNACIWQDVELTCWHYDKAADGYKPQPMRTAAVMFA